MSQIIRAPQTLSPSIKGSKPVSEVLSGIQVRDPQHKPSGVYGRRITDFESHSPGLQMTALFAIAGLLVGSFFSVSLQKFGETWNVRPFRSSVVIPSQPPEYLIVPKAIHPLPRSIRRPPDEGTLDAQGIPENLHARFMGPRELELRWDSLGEGYVYRLYAAADSSLQNAQPISEQPVQASNMTWVPNDGVQTVWLAVKGINQQGRQTAFSRPFLVRLPF